MNQSPEQQAIPIGLPQTLELTPKEELAVIAERLRKHIEDTKDIGAKTRLQIASDLIRVAVYSR